MSYRIRCHKYTNEDKKTFYYLFCPTTNKLLLTRFLTRQGIRIKHSCKSKHMFARISILVKITSLKVWSILLEISFMIQERQRAKLSYNQLVSFRSIFVFLPFTCFSDKPKNGPFTEKLRLRNITRKFQMSVNRFVWLSYLDAVWIYKR